MYICRVYARKMPKIRYRLETIGVRATVLNVETDKRTTGLLVSVPIGRYPIRDTGIGLTLCDRSNKHRNHKIYKDNRESFYEKYLRFICNYGARRLLRYC